MDSPTEREKKIRLLISELQNHIFCSPDADYNAITYTTCSYRALLTQIQKLCSRVLPPELQRELESIQVEINDIFSAYEAKIQIEALSYDIIEFLNSHRLPSPPKTISSSRGRPAMYDWDEFHRQIILIANHPDGLPELQAGLETQMTEWCENKWPKCPGESTIRDKISPIYKLIRKGQ